MVNTFRVLVGNPERKKLLKRPGHTWEDSIKMDLQQTGLEGIHWVHLAQDRDQWGLL
jgi:hypothetical protein